MGIVSFQYIYICCVYGSVLKRPGKLAILSTKFLNVKRKLLRGADERCEKLDRNAILPKIENLFTFIHKRKRHILDT